MKSGKLPLLNFNSLSINKLLFSTFNEYSACFMLLYVCCCLPLELSPSPFLFFGAILQKQLYNEKSPKHFIEHVVYNH
ncbi:hypothetical protein Fmac_014919 [Flemingia macrophylla]|uniref:Uncharacterized protein n=1 Tax=Flemingia macrophylla TaxID=520843 RepID=A0ABD1MD48_9FABA